MEVDRYKRRDFGGARDDSYCRRRDGWESWID